MSALGVTILLGTPLLAQADQGKWWKPKEGGQRVERQDRGWQRSDQGSQRGRSQGDRGGAWQGRSGGDRAGTWRDRGTVDRGGSTRERGTVDRGDRTRDRGTVDRGGAWQGRSGGDRAGTWRDRGTVDRSRTRGDRSGVWRDRQVSDRQVRDRQLRDRVIVRDRNFGSRRLSGGTTYRDRQFSSRGILGGYSSWRGVPVRRDVLVIRDNRYPGGYFRARRFYCAPRFYGGFVYVRPVRFFISADAFFGPVGIRARIVRPHYLYGCNFCDARFDTYGAYCQHVEHCDYRPDDCQISVSNWDDSDYDSSWDGPYQTNDDQGYDDDSYYDEDSYE
ncbi:MAG TPA: hypothetical protein VK527_00020 [Candidatus Limnocylindrales bacterium]|nr:hypothetical protein [Candidatus Limnocylindrales bacterium]